MSIAYRLSAFNRKRKWGHFLDEIKPTQELRVLDLGFSENEYSETDNYIEKYYPYPEMLTALGIETPDEFERKYPEVSAIHYDGDTFPFVDKSFDVCWSNAVIEHVGNRDKQLLFLSEIKRVSKKGFISTPNKYFPIELHTRTPLLHYLPNKIFEKVLSITGRGWATGDYMRLLSISDMKSLLRDAGISEYKIIKNKLMGFTIDFVVVF